MAELPDKGSVALWDQTWGTVNQMFGGGGDNKVQLIYPRMDWTWPVPPAGYIDVTEYNVVGQMPKWSAIGKYQPSSTDLHSSYMSTLINCPNLSITPAQQQQVKEIDDEINARQTKLTEDTNAAYYNFEQAKANTPAGVPPPDYNSWMKDNGWTEILDADRKGIAKAVNTKLDIVGQQNPENKESIAAAQLPTDKFGSKPGFSKCNVNGSPEWRAGFIVNSGRDWIAQLTKGGGEPLNIHIEASKSTHSMTESWAGGATDYGGFFGLYAEGSWHDMKLAESDSSVSVDINIKAVTQVPVRAGQWYNSGYLKTLAKQGKWNEPYTTEGGEHAVFGKGGMLPLMITGLIAGYKTSFTIKMSSSTYDRHVSDFKASAGIRIGPFHIGGDYNHHSDNWTKNASGTSFSGESNAEYPFILGFYVASPGLD